jgi:hypothetical protein
MVKIACNWDNQELLELHVKAKSALGFVYKITRKSDGKFYIGKKLLFFKTKKKRKGKRAVRGLKESDWKSYYGSSNDLKVDVAKLGKAAFTREVIHICQSKFQMSYLELLEQLKYNVMDCKVNTYNGIINVRLRKPKC